MIIVLLSSAFRLGCFPISCSAFRASRTCFFYSAGVYYFQTMLQQGAGEGAANE